MKQILLPCVAVVAAITLAGCGRKPAAAPADPASEIGVLYHPKKGLLVPAETARFIGLATADVVERPVNVTREISARVFRPATTDEPRALASASVAAAGTAVFRAGLTGVTAPGALTSIVQQLDRTQEPQHGSVEAILQIEDAAQSLPDGAFVTIRFTESSTNAVTVVPRVALLHTTEGDFVYTANEDYLIRAAVKLGRTDGEFVEVTEGLYAGDKVVVRPVMTLWMTELHNVNGGDACCIVSKPKE